MLVEHFLVFVLVAITTAIDQCTTPNHQQGDCKAINECQSLFALLQNGPIPSSVRDYLRKSQCGYLQAYPKVCCPIGSSLPPQEETSVIGGSNGNASVITMVSDVLPDMNDCGISFRSLIPGENTELDELPWIALIEYEKPGGGRGFYCGGVLISEKYILTAAHCVKNVPKTWKLVSVRLGEYNTETETDCVSYGIGEDCMPPPITIPVEEKIVHEDYDPDDRYQYHDIALLRLKRNVSFSDFIRPICLPTPEREQQKSYIGEKLSVAGWGKNVNRSESSVKLEVRILVRNLSDCSSTYSFANVSLGSAQICAGGQKSRDSCKGDSGGSLMAYNQQNKGEEFRWYAAGVESFGPSSCGTQNWPKVYSKVSEYLSWIDGKLKN